MVQRLARALHAKASHMARGKASVAACSRVSPARASQPTRAEASAASGLSGGAAASSLITGASDEHAYELFEVEDRCSDVDPLCLNGQTDGVGLRCLISTYMWANIVINGFK